MTDALSHRIAYLPEQRAGVVTEEWLDWLQGLGYNGIYFEFDPFAPTRSGNVSQFPTFYRLISLYDLAYGEQRQRLRELIAHACELAHARGMKVYLALWEPRIPAEAWGLFPVEWHGRGGWDRSPWNTISWCTSHPEAGAAFDAMAVEALRSIPDIDGLKLGTHDNDAHHCNDDCPRCRGLSRGQKTRLVFERLIRAIDAAGLHRETFDYVLYTWWWPREAVDAIAPLLEGRRVTILSRSTQNLPQHWRGQELGRVFDLALGLRGVSDDFRRDCEEAGKRGWAIADMTAFGHAIEYFWLPYTPAPNRVAERIVGLREAGASGWFDYDCGGVYPGINTEVIRLDSASPGQLPEALVQNVLEHCFVGDSIAAAGEAYRLAEEALAARPIGFNTQDIANLSGRNVMEFCIAFPFEISDITGLDQGHRQGWSAPQNWCTPQSLPTLLDMYSASASAWAEVDRRFAGLVPAEAWAAIFAWEGRVVKAHALCAASAWRYLRMADLRLSRGRGDRTASEERQALLALLREELADVEIFAPMWRQDRRLLMNTNIRLSHVLQSCIPWVRIDLDDPFSTKLSHTRAAIERLADETLDTTPCWP